MVITIIILIILATITINFAFGENGLITRAQWAQEQYEIEQVREKLEMAKGSAFADGKGKIDPDHYFDILEQEEIIGSKENDVKDNGDGTYDVTTNEGYIFEITLVPSAENPEDLEIEYVGKGDVTGPRITSFTSTGKTTNSISVAVEGRNLDGAEYTYSYKKSSEGEETWTEYETSENSTCTISGLETGVVYDIKVVVTTSEGTAEKELSEITGELKDAQINMDNIVWQGDGTAKLTITANVDLQGYKLQYQKNGTSGSWTEITNGSEITVELNDEIYARIYDGTNTLANGYRKISDNGLPIVNITKAGEATTNSITVNVTATDAESGMKDNATYTYYIKESSQEDTAYVAKATDVTNTSYTFTELKQNTNYDIKVEVDGDRAGNKGEDTLLNQATTEIAGASEGLREGSIVATAPSWSNGQASITLTTDTGLKIQYQKGGITGNWTTIDSGGQATGLNHNDTVYARLWDGTNAGASASVEIRDTIDPVINSVTTSNITSNSITVTVDAIDNETGLATSDTYKYYLNNGSAITSTSNSYTFNNLTAETMYTIKVEVFDKAENKGEDSVTVTTGSETIESILKAGDYVNYIDKNGTTRKCVVLYDSSSEYGIQIITMNTVEEISMLHQFCDPSHTTIDLSQYNNIITILNTEAEKYLNPTFASMARSVGSVPDNPNYDGAGMYTINESWMAKYSGTFKDTDNNYEEDMNQMKLLQIDNIGEYYLMASRFVEYDNADNWITITLFVRNYSPSSGENWGPLILMSNENWSSPGSSTHTEGLRPVFKLKDNLKVTGGDGSEGDPYTLGV
mgnify:CR=1 FL=1